MTLSVVRTNRLMIDQARVLLTTPVDRTPSQFAALGAAALAAAAATVMACVMVLGTG